MPLSESKTAHKGMPDITAKIAASSYLSRLQSEVSDGLNLAREQLLENLDRICRSLEFEEPSADAGKEPSAEADTEPSAQPNKTPSAQANKEPSVDEKSCFSELAAAQARLLQAKSDFSFVWASAELHRVGSQSELGRWQTRFAEVTIEYALRWSWFEVAAKQRSLQKVVADHHGKVPGLFIFGMGKLGGNDLNFSSDVDLVAYFDPELIPVPDMLGKSYICHQVLLKLTQLLSQGGDSNFVWRVDWRLRPNASATTLAMSVVAAQDYYFYHASPWHRLALMKARVVAGDYSSGDRFLHSLAPFIWRQNLDYRALDELAEIKQRINLEHPALRAQRQWREPITEEVAGFNIKLGSGGIREIEFIANALQLVWGGRINKLRDPSTEVALHALAANKQLGREVAGRLIDGYQALRRIENAIQLLGNQQTHLVPTTEKSQAALLTLLSIEKWPQFVTRLNDIRQFVNRHFSELFAEQENAKEHAIVWPSGLSTQADDIVESWESGYQCYGVSNQVRHRLLPLTRGIATYLNEQDDQEGDSASDTIVRLHEFFRALPSGEQYFRLLAESPLLLRSIVPPLLHSPPMTTLLKQSPHIIDCYVQGEWKYANGFDSDYVEQAADYGERLERMRRFVNEHLYQLYLSFLQGSLAVEGFQKALTDLAEHSLELAMRVVAQNMQLEQVPITVVGMGKIALRRMSPLSDLDLIFMFDQDAYDLELTSRFVSRLQTAIATPMREGILYELDTRLRPSGRSGAPTVSVESFANHHFERAHSWEHIALMPSRVVAGNRGVEPRVSDIKRQIVARERNQDQLKRDALKMWRRITQHRVTDSPIQEMNSKLRVGGLMQAEYLAACLILKHAASVKLDSVELDSMLSAVLPKAGFEELPEIIQFWRIQQLWERLLGMSGHALSSMRDQYFSRLLGHSGVSSMDELLSKKKRYANLVENGMNEFFDGLELSDAEIETWLETSVSWK